MEPTDFEKLIQLPKFEDLLKSDGVLKQVLIFTLDREPDENPRYQKTI